MTRCLSDPKPGVRTAGACGTLEWIAARGPCDVSDRSLGVILDVMMDDPSLLPLLRRAVRSRWRDRARPSLVPLVTAIRKRASAHAVAVGTLAVSFLGAGGQRLRQTLEQAVVRDAPDALDAVYALQRIAPLSRRVLEAVRQWAANHEETAWIDEIDELIADMSTKDAVYVAGDSARWSALLRAGDGRTETVLAAGMWALLDSKNGLQRPELAEASRWPRVRRRALGLALSDKMPARYCAALLSWGGRSIRVEATKTILRGASDDVDTVLRKLNLLSLLGDESPECVAFYEMAISHANEDVRLSALRALVWPTPVAVDGRRLCLVGWAG